MKFLRNDPRLRQRRRALRRNQTDAEKAFWANVRNRKFHGVRFFRQYSLGPYIMDFYCPTLKLAVELDGGQHLDIENKEHDKGRSEYLKSHGIEVVRFLNHEVLTNMHGVLAVLEERVTPRTPLK